VIVLQTTSQTLNATLAAGVSTTALDMTAVYFDYLPQRTDSQQRFASQEEKVSSATVTTMVSAPGADGIVRNITNLNIYNRDVTSATLTLLKQAGAVSTLQIKQTLTTGQTLVYEHGTGWQVL
jgi:hypothetical protein